MWRLCCVVLVVLLCGAKGVQAEETSPNEEIVSSSESLGPTYPVSFYGVETYANGVIFCLDTSGSTRGAPTLRMLQELERSLRLLPKEVRFQVYLTLNDEKPRMFRDGELVTPSEKSINAALKFAYDNTKSRVSKTTSRPDQVINIALAKPVDVIYYMSDGFWGEVHGRLVTRQNQIRKFPPAHINVIGVGVKNQLSHDNLRHLAENNGGQLLLVP